MIPPLASRDDIPALLKARGLNGIGIEIGVWTGVYSSRILADSSLSRLFSIDVWSEQFSPEGKSLDLFVYCAAELWKYGHRSVMVRLPGLEAASLFEDESVDFCYIDSDHSFASTIAEMEVYWPKIRPGGILAGHDYANGIDVRRAVDAFATERNLVVYQTEDDNIPFPILVNSWLLEKV